MKNRLTVALSALDKCQNSGKAFVQAPGAPVVKEAIRVLKEGKAFPKPDENDNEAASEGGPVAQNYDYRPTHLRTTLVAKG